ncbi:MAG TPA: hypothetical protein VLL75_10590 [Vicinamibacteria bacterium]|nr:hypothetical protein [Vicinamibacteria bacterium]
MNRRVPAALFLAAALGLHFGVTLPARRQRDEAREGFARGREERERLRAQAALLEHRAAAGRAPAGDAAAVRALRLSLLQAIEGLPLGAVRIGAEAARGAEAAARGRLVAEGRQADVLRAAGRLAEPSSGVLLARVSLVEARGGEVRLEVEAYSVRSES